MKTTTQFDLLMAAVAQRLRHQPRLQTDMRVSHIPVDLGLRDERCHGVDYHDIDRTGPHHRLRDLERLLAVVGL